MKNLKKRNLWMCLLLSILTVGLYDIYWAIMLIKETNYFTRGKLIVGMKILLTIVTCGLYLLVWVSDIGTDLYYAGKAKKVKICDKSILYVVLIALAFIFEFIFELPINISIPVREGIKFTLGIAGLPAGYIIMFLVQNDLNKLASKK